MEEVTLKQRGEVMLKPRGKVTWKFVARKHLPTTNPQRYGSHQTSTLQQRGRAHWVPRHDREIW